MAANGISTLSTKEARQIAKLELAATKRAADGNPRATYDITLLPTRYDGNDVVDNLVDLVEGRPWLGGAPMYRVEFRSVTGDNFENYEPGGIITTCNEGGLIWFNVVGTNVPENPDAYLQFGGASVTNLDAQWPFAENILDPIPYNLPGTGTSGAPILIEADNLTEGNETLTLSWIVNSVTVATSSVRIVDTSTN